MEGVEVRSGFDRVAALAEAEGIRFVSPKRLRNSAKAHQAALAVEHADPDAAERYHDGLYAAYWEDELDVSDPEVLVELAADVAIDPDLLRRVLANDELLPALRASMARANEWGISATPSWAVRWAACHSRSAGRRIHGRRHRAPARAACPWHELRSPRGFPRLPRPRFVSRRNRCPSWAAGVPANRGISSRPCPRRGPWRCRTPGPAGERRRGWSCNPHCTR